MGRKSTDKTRILDKEKKKSWSMQLFPFLQKNGIRTVTMDQLAKYLNKSKSTLYEYFNSKEEIIGLSLIYKLKDLSSYPDILKDESLDHKTRYQNFIQFISSRVSDISNVFMYDLRNYFPDSWTVVNDFLQEMLQELKSFYEDAIQKGVFRNAHIELISKEDELFIFEILMNPEFLQKSGLSLNTLAEEYLALKLNGLAAR